MAIIKRTNDWLPSIINDFFGNEWFESSNKSVPAINILEKDNGFTVEVAVPGMTKEDCNVRLDEANNTLVIEVEKKSEKEDKDKKGSYLRREFSYTQFQRRMILPDNVEKDKISAKVENGVLTVDIPVVNEVKEGNARLIEIQ